MTARSDQVGRSAGRAATRGRRRVRGDIVVPRQGRPGAVRSTDREDLGVVGWIGETLRARTFFVTRVSGSRDHDDARLPGLLDRVGERVELVCLGRVRAVRQVYDADVQAVVVAVLHDPIDRCNHLAHVDPAVRDADLEGDDARVRRNAAVAAQLAVVAGNQPGHERPVPVRVEVLQARILRFQREVRPVDHLAGPVQPRHGGHACIDDRHVYALAGIARVPPGLHAVGRCDVLH